MKTVIIIFVVTFIMLFVAGCGPGQPFEIEGRLALQSSTPELAVAK